MKLWQAMLAGPLLIGLGIYEYVDLAAWERDGGLQVMNKYTLALYDLGGKAAVAGFWVILGLVYMEGVRRYFAYRRRADQLAAQHRERLVEKAAARVEPAPAPRRAPTWSRKPAAAPTTGAAPATAAGTAPATVAAPATAAGTSAPAAAPAAPAASDDADGGPRFLR